MRKRTPSQEVKYVEHLGEIGCGRAVEALDNVLPFAAKSSLFPVALPANVPATNAAIMTVRGLSLTDFNVFDGDRLVIKKKFDWRETNEDTIFAVYIHATGELAAKRIEKGANKLILKASGGGIPDTEYSVDEVELRGIVIDFLIDAQTQIARAREAKSRLHRNGTK